MVLNRTETREVQIPVATYSGVTLIRQAGQGYGFTLWTEVGKTLAISANATVTVQVKTYSDLTVGAIGQRDTLVVAADGSFDLNRASLLCSLNLSGGSHIASLNIEVMSPSGSPTVFETQPFRLQFPSCT